MGLPAVTLKERLMLLLGRRRSIKVDGDSMLPTLRSGDVVLVDPDANACVGDIVVVDHPYKQSVKLIKRVGSIDANGRYFLIGDDPDSSTDSRILGSIARSDVIGKVVSRFLN